MTEETVKSNEYHDDSRHSSKATIFSLALALLIASLGVSITNVALPTLAHKFDATISSVSWVVIAYLMSVTSFIIGAGVLGDIFGRKLLLLLGLGIFLCASLMCALSVDLWMLVGARLIQGVGAAFILSQAIAFASSAVPRARIGSVMGLMSSTAAIGTALGPAAGGMLLHSFGWQSIFWLMFPMASISFLLCAKFISSDVLISSRTAKQYDFAGTLLLGLCCLLYALSMTGGNSMVTTSGITLFLSSIVVLMLFLRSQRKQLFPLIDLGFFKNKMRNVTLLSNFLVDAVAMSTLVVGPYYMTYAMGLSAIQVGTLMSVGPLVAACSGYPSGKLVDLIGVKRVMLLGLSQMAIGALCFAYLPVLFGVFGYIAALIVLTPGRQLFLASNQTYVMNSVSEKEKGLASGVLNLAKNLGLMTGASMMAGLFALQLNTDDVAQATQQQLAAAFTGTFLLAGLLICGSLVSICLFSNQNTDFN